MFLRLFAAVKWISEARAQRAMSRRPGGS